MEQLSNLKFTVIGVSTAVSRCCSVVSSRLFITVCQSSQCVLLLFCCLSKRWHQFMASRWKFRLQFEFDSRHCHLFQFFIVFFSLHSRSSSSSLSHLKMMYYTFIAQHSRLGAANIVLSRAIEVLIWWSHCIWWQMTLWNGSSRRRRRYHLWLAIAKFIRSLYEKEGQNRHFRNFSTATYTPDLYLLLLLFEIKCILKNIWVKHKHTPGTRTPQWKTRNFSFCFRRRRWRRLQFEMNVDE